MLLLLPLMEEIDNKWYSERIQRYKSLVISFNPKDKFNAWQVFPMIMTLRSNIKTWYEMGYVVGENDEHCTEKGLTKVLNEYILPLVKNLLIPETISVILKDVKHYKTSFIFKELKRKSVNGKRLYENLKAIPPWCYYYLRQNKAPKTKASLLIGKNVLVKKKHNAL